MLLKLPFDHKNYIFIITKHLTIFYALHDPFEDKISFSLIWEQMVFRIYLEFPSLRFCSPWIGVPVHQAVDFSLKKGHSSKICFGSLE